MRIRKASSVFGRLANIWKSKSISLPVKIKLYESLANFNTNVRRRVMATSSHTDEKESPAIADKPARRESMPKLLKFDVLTTLSLTIRLAVVASEICEIPRSSLKMQTYRVRGHPRSSILVPIESAYVLSY